MSPVKYPEIEVQLIGRDGNAVSLLGAVRSAMKQAGLTNEQIDEYTNEATSGDYNHLLQVTMTYVEVT